VEDKTDGVQELARFALDSVLKVALLGSGLWLLGTGEAENKNRKTRKFSCESYLQHQPSNYEATTYLEHDLVKIEPTWILILSD
jgi:hypothetical protein